MMNSALTIAMLNVGEGGAQRAMVNLANRLVAGGRSVRILAGERKGAYLNQLDPAVTVVQMGPGMLRMVRTMIGELRGGVVPAVLATQMKPVIACAVAKLFAGSSARIVFRPPNRLNVRATSVRHAWAQWALRFLYREGDGFIAVSGAIADDLVEMGIARSDIAIIPNGIDMAAISERSGEGLEDPWFTESTSPTIIAVGRLTEQKGFDTLLRALAKVIECRPNTRLMILGEGEMRGDLESLARALDIENNVRMPGFVANPYAYLARAGLFVLSSRWEGSPNALLEALACGCSVVATDCPSGPREILIEEGLGRLTPVDDVKAMAADILAMLDEAPAPAQRKAFVAARFGIDQWAERYVSMLQGIQ